MIAAMRNKRTVPCSELEFSLMFCRSVAGINLKWLAKHLPRNSQRFLSLRMHPLYIRTVTRRRHRLELHITARLILGEIRRSPFTVCRSAKITYRYLRKMFVRYVIRCCHFSGRIRVGHTRAAAPFLVYALQHGHGQTPFPGSLFLITSNSLKFCMKLRITAVIYRTLYA